MNRTPKRQGLSLPLVVLLCACLGIALMYFINTVVSLKRQNKVNFRQVQAQFLAQAGLQHALLKLRILPNESYDAACLARGLCPYFITGTTPPVPGPKQMCLMEKMKKDLRTVNYPIGFDDPEFAGWSYEVTELNALTATLENSDQTHAVEIKALATTVTPFKGEKVTTEELVTKVVKIQRIRSPSQ